jgi:DNA-binding winged helix-turn-helix (wHTH) protein
VGYRTFGEFFLDPVARSFRGPSGPISMSAQPLDLLLILTERPGMVVTRDELRDVVWRSAVVPDATIDQAIRRLRVVISDDRMPPRFIETVSGEGYRFIAPVLVIEEPVPSQKANFKSWHALVGFLICAIAGLWLWRILTPGSPSAWRIEGNRLVVLGADGRKLWDHAFTRELPPDRYERGRPCQFADLTNTGRLDTVFWFLPPSPAQGVPKLMCFNSVGKLRWEYAAEHSVTDANGREYTPPFLPERFAVVESKHGSAHIVVSSHHHVGFPNQVANLDGDGNLISEFWHRGHLSWMEVADLDGDGEPEVFLAGVNDAPEYKRASIVIFDHRKISGGSRSPLGIGYFKGVGPGTEKAEIFFPRTPLSASQEFNRVVELNVYPNRIMAIVAEGMPARRSRNARKQR